MGLALRRKPLGHDFGKVRIHGSGSGPLQPKLAISQPGDKYEREADRVAEQIMRMPDSTVRGAASTEAIGQDSDAYITRGIPSIQRICTKCAIEEENLQRTLFANAHATPRISALSDPIARRFAFPNEASVINQQEMEEEEDILQMKTTPSKSPNIQAGIEADIQSLQDSGQPLAPAERVYFESRFGHDFSYVRIHTDAQAAASARAVHARAFTTGQNVVFGTGEYAPATTMGRRLLAHELTHVVQQRQTPAHLIQREPQDEVQLESPPSEESKVPRKFVMRRDIVFMMAFEEAAKLASADAEVFEVRTPEEMASTLKSINFPIRTIYVFAHSSPEAEIKFPGSGWVTATSLASTLKDSVNPMLSPTTVDFRGCSVGMNPAGMEELRRALWAQDIIGSSCYMVFETLPFTVDRVHIEDPKQLKDPRVKVTFDRDFPTHWEKFISKACILDTSREAYFKAGGYLVSVFANKQFTALYSEKDSVCYKDLPVSTLSPEEALTSTPSAAAPCTLVRVDRDA